MKPVATSRHPLKRDTDRVVGVDRLVLGPPLAQTHRLASHQINCRVKKH